MTTRIAVGREAPFAIEVMVYEEDTYRVLSAGNHIRDIREPLAELQHDAANQEAHTVGDIVIKGTRLFAIVYDFDLPQPFTVEAVEQSLQKLSAHISEAEIQSIGLQALGSRHGSLSEEVSTALIHNQTWPDCLERIWISV